MNKRWAPFLAAFLFALVGLFHSGKSMVHTSSWKPEVPAWESSYERPKMWGAPLGVLTDNPFAGTRDQLDTHDSFGFPNFAFNYFFWLVVAYPLGAISRGFYRQWKLEREYSRNEKLNP